MPCRVQVQNSGMIEIVAFEPQHQPAFRHLNEEWISRWFRMEAADYDVLEHPQDYILDKGGHILMALDAGEPVGTCALLRVDADTFELAKMSVAERIRGQRVGQQLGEAAIDKAKRLGARRLVLESNTVLELAIRLYRKLGFRELCGAKGSAYQRCNIQMELVIRSE